MITMHKVDCLIRQLKEMKRDFRNEIEIKNNLFRLQQIAIEVNNHRVGTWR